MEERPCTHDEEPQPWAPTDADGETFNGLLREAIEEALAELCQLQADLEQLGPPMRALQQRGAIVLKFIYAARALITPATITDADLAWARTEARRLGLVWEDDSPRRGRPPGRPHAQRPTPQHGSL